LVDHFEASFPLRCRFGAYLGYGLSRLALDLLGRTTPKRLSHRFEYPTTLGPLLIQPDESLKILTDTKAATGMPAFSTSTRVS
jgi:hypothetical protein